VEVSLQGRHENGTSLTPENTNCFEAFSSAQYEDIWITVASFLKEGDVLTLQWCADHFNTGYLERSLVGEGWGEGMKLHADALYLMVRKPAKGQKKRQQFSFLLSVSVCVDNTARMIRRQ
jgi:hypothetical protein